MQRFVIPNWDFYEPIVWRYGPQFINAIHHDREISLGDSRIPLRSSTDRHDYGRGSAGSCARGGGSGFGLGDYADDRADAGA